MIAECACRRRSISVAIIDDDVGFAQSLGELLGLHPEVELAGIAHSVAGGLELLRLGSVDIALVDVQMPDGGGAAVEQAMRGPGAPSIIMISAHDGIAVAAAGRPFIPKQELSIARFLEVVGHLSP